MNLNPHQSAVHRLTVLRKLEALNPPPATNQAPRPAVRPVDPMRGLRAAGEKLDRRLDEARALLASLRTSKTPVAAARKAETIVRSAAAELGTARREAAKSAAMTAESYLASIARPTMNRAEFDKLIHRERNAFIRSGGKLSD
jgi:type IV secretory pathway VirB10-like protein